MVAVYFSEQRMMLERGRAPAVEQPRSVTGGPIIQTDPRPRDTA